MYNQRLINTFENSFYDKLLLSKYEYNNLYGIKLNRFNPNTISNCSLLVKLDALNNYIAKNVLETPQNLNRKAISEYRDFVFDLFSKKPMTSLDNLLFHDNVARNLFTVNQYNKIKEYKNAVVREIKVIYFKIKKNEKIDKNEHDKYLLFLISQLNEPSKNFQQLLDESFNIIINKFDKKSLLAKEFILKYVAQKATQDNNIPQVNVYISNDHLNGDIYENNTNGCSYGNTSVVTINRNIVINEKEQYPGISPLAKMMQTIVHETRHSAQAYKASLNILTFESFEYVRNLLFNKYMTEKEFNEYAANYKHSEIERDSNIYGWVFTSKILEKNAFNQSDSIKKLLSQGIYTEYSGALGYKTDGSTRKISEIYNVYYLDFIIKNHPNELKNYPILQYFYNFDGTRKNIIEMIHIENNITNTKNAINLNKLFNEYYSFDIKNGILKNTDIKNFSLEDQYLFVEKIISLLLKEIKNLSHTITILNKTNLKEFEKVNFYRIGKINYLLKFFQDYEDLILKLREIDINNNNVRAFGFSIDTTMQSLNSLQSKIIENNFLVETSIYNDLLNLGKKEFISKQL